MRALVILDLLFIGRSHDFSCSFCLEPARSWEAEVSRFMDPALTTLNELGYLERLIKYLTKGFWFPKIVANVF